MRGQIAVPRETRMAQLMFRFLVGGLIVSLFATLGDVLKPKSFAGLFGAAPSVGLATLALTVMADGKSFASTEARSMAAEHKSDQFALSFDPGFVIDAVCQRCGNSGEKGQRPSHQAHPGSDKFCACASLGCDSPCSRSLAFRAKKPPDCSPAWMRTATPASFWIVLWAG